MNNPIDLKTLRRIWERVNITTTQLGTMDSEVMLQLISMAEAREYAYPTVEDFEKYNRGGVTQAFKVGWGMARITNTLIKEMKDMLHDT